jgi:hypothetical protein
MFRTTALPCLRHTTQQCLITSPSVFARSSQYAHMMPAKSVERAKWDNINRDSIYAVVTYAEMLSSNISQPSAVKSTTPAPAINGSVVAVPTNRLRFADVGQQPNSAACATRDAYSVQGAKSCLGGYQPR